jgi:hypothetical protein
MNHSINYGPSPGYYNQGHHQQQRQQQHQQQQQQQYYEGGDAYNCDPQAYRQGLPYQYESRGGGGYNNYNNSSPHHQIPLSTPYNPQFPINSGYDGGGRVGQPHLSPGMLPGGGDMRHPIGGDISDLYKKEELDSGNGDPDQKRMKTAKDSSSSVLINFNRPKEDSGNGVGGVGLSSDKEVGSSSNRDISNPTAATVVKREQQEQQQGEPGNRDNSESWTGEERTSKNKRKPGESTADDQKTNHRDLMDNLESIPKLPEIPPELSFNVVGSGGGSGRSPSSTVLLTPAPPDQKHNQQQGESGFVPPGGVTNNPGGSRVMTCEMSSQEQQEMMQQQQQEIMQQQQQEMMRKQHPIGKQGLEGTP